LGAGGLADGIASPKEPTKICPIADEFFHVVAPDGRVGNGLVEVGHQLLFGGRRQLGQLDVVQVQSAVLLPEERGRHRMPDQSLQPFPAKPLDVPGALARHPAEPTDVSGIANGLREGHFESLTDLSISNPATRASYRQAGNMATRFAPLPRSSSPSVIPPPIAHGFANIQRSALA